MSEATTQEQQLDMFRQEDGKWVYEFQPTDENEKPIGRPVRVLGDTQKECFANFQKAYNEAVRGIHKLKTGTAKPDLTNAQKRGSDREVKPREWTADEAFQAHTELLNPQTMRKTIRKAMEDEIGAPIEEMRDSISRTRRIDQEFANRAFLEAHADDYFPCLENGKALVAWLRENNLAHTVENLDTAFSYLKDSLIQRPQEANTQQQPRTEANPSTTQRQSATTGIVPGESSGARPTTPGRSKGLTWAIVDSWSDAEFERNYANPVMRAQIDALPSRTR
jgi:hypothetical protein